MSPTWHDYLPLNDAALLAQCEFDRFRASGPGGQKRNKTESAVRLRHRPTGLTGDANESRSQHENRARALRRLRFTIATKVRQPIDVEAHVAPPPLAAALADLPGPRSTTRLEAFAALFDVLEAMQWRVADAARVLGTTTAAITRLLACDDDLWRAATERRQVHGLPPLRSGTLR
jgi:hypothetical protein